MNLALVKEVGIAGVQIWKAIEDINVADIPKRRTEYVVADYIFTSLYQAAQGIERLLKVIIELIMYDNAAVAEKQQVSNLLYGHNHPAMFDFISEKESVSLKPNCKRLLNLLSDFYSNVRYSRYIFNENNLLELELLQNFGRDIKEDDFSEQLKHLYGKSLGQTVQALYELIEVLSVKLNIYVYELNADSVAYVALTGCCGVDLYEALKRTEQSKKELIWYLMKNGSELPAAKITDELLSLSFDQDCVPDYLKSLIKNENACSDLCDFVSSSYDELAKQDKAKWKERVDAIDALVGNPNVILDWDEDRE
ncbi:MAG: hypothetical protein LBJ11_00195 [Oscillospiraceae bacterium]|nr:hypothetical protein [Oscillospiraceae bacterium]